MYIEKLCIKNYGPIEYFELIPSFNDDGSPRPIVLMGRNGSGKTLILSQIVQAIMIYKSGKYRNRPEGDVDQLYKVISTSYISSGAVDSIIDISFGKGSYTYTEILSKRPKLTIDKNHFPEYSEELKNNSDFNENGIYNKENGILKYEDNVFLFYPVDRYYIPGWKNNNLNLDIRAENKILGDCNRNVLCNSIQNDFEGFIINTIVDKFLYDNKQMIVDATGKIVKDSDGLPKYVYKGKNESTIAFLNRIINTFKDSKYISKRLFVGKKENRKIGIMGKKKDGSEEEIIDSLSKLSTGEYSLLSIFAGILMDFDKTGNRGAFNFEDISGVVLIDEAELNLHIDLQMNVLPKLMKLFKNVQFIITTQSPFLVYGFNEVYNGLCDIYEMPSGCKIEKVSDLSEVKASCDAMLEYNQELNDLIKKAKNEIDESNKDLFVITEGKTDCLYLEKAKEKLKVLHGINIKFIGLGTEETKKFGVSGCSGLDELSKALTVITPNKPVVLLYDRDIKDKELLENEFIEFDSNIYKMALPIPSHRNEDDDISIEHYFKDEEIMKKDKENRRLYLGKEFNKNGLSLEENLMCDDRNACGSNSLKILDGSKKRVVYSQDDEECINIALPKSQFAKNIYEDVENFNDFDFSEFNKIFSVFEKILS